MLASAYDVNEINVKNSTPADLQGVGVDQHLGAKLDLSVPFTDDHGVTGPLGRFFNQGKPILMAIVYYSCPGLCNYHLNGLTEDFKQLKWVAGKDFEVIAISMLASETPKLAADKKDSYLQSYGHPEAADGWHFLVGSKENIDKVASQVGFRFRWIESEKQFAHAAASYVLTPTGKISRYLMGIQPEIPTLRMSLVEAGHGAVGSVLEQVMMFCFQFDPHKNKYTLYAWNVMRIGAILMVLLLAVVLIPLWRRDRAAKASRVMGSAN